MATNTKARSKTKSATASAGPRRSAIAKSAAGVTASVRRGASNMSKVAQRSAGNLSGSTAKAANARKAMKSSPLNPSRVLPRAATMTTAENFLSGLANIAPTRLTSQVKEMAGQVMGWAGTAAEMAVGATAPLIKEPKGRAAMEKAGAVLRDARETAGLTADDVAAALDFSDTNLLDLAESGRIALPFEVILRLASLLARNDPIPFVMNLTRIYNPGLWKIVEQLGIGKLALHVGREREFINIYRANDQARQLKDDEFKLVLEFTASAFNSAVELAMLTHAKRQRTKGKPAAE